MDKHRYGRGLSRFGELLLPPGGPGARRLPVAVVVHGGFWRATHGRRVMWPVCGDLARRGWAVWNLEYRRLGLAGRGGWPATFDDVADGVDHLRLLPAPLDLDRVAVLGHSAGGHLALWAASRRDAAVPVRAAVSQAGILDLAYACELGVGDGAVHRLLGGGPDDVPERYAAASPAARVPIGVPVLCTHGALDAVVPAAMSERFAEKARLAGDDCTLEVFDGEDHMGHVDPENPMWRSAADWLAARTD